MVVTSPDWEREFADYVAARSRLLCTTAYLLCGDWHRAEDLTQTVLTKLYWPGGGSTGASRWTRTRGGCWSVSCGQ